MADGQGIIFRESAGDREREAFIARLHTGEKPFRDAEGGWIISRFDDARAILLDAQRFSSREEGAGGFPLLQDDPPRHTALRGLLQKAFTPGRIVAMQPEVEEISRDLAGAIQAGAETDVVEAITSPLPVIVIARMLGVAESDREQFRRWSNQFAGAADELDQVRVQALTDMGAYLAMELAKRRANPGGGDLISALAKAEEAGITLNDQEIISLSVLLLVAGNETTTNLFSNMLNWLAAHPDEWRALRENPALIDGAIEEMLRVDSPVQFTVRYATTNLEIGGVSVRAGDALFVYLAAANRDPLKWPNPDQLDITRERGRQLAFGLGVHHCIGAPLARLEVKAGLAALLSRFESVRYGAGPRPRTTSALLRGFQTLPLVFS